ncbi:hypothetical protein MGMO_91c00170 [Methyloglobulus morosus KoM1]|uniref:DUF4390 domain-containing protein n=2 Tax=Methyloglobulus TaxID=1410680 RepID=V5DWQ1_9GAMM|nr:hypothetical protein MGMO_91c00170 [Methyloglobulus morosus KoM1]
MRGSLSNKATIVLCSLLFLTPALAYPGNTGVIIKNAETSLLGDDYVLTADIDYQLSEKAIEALNNGVSLYWTYQFRIRKHRDFLWDNTLVEKSFRYRIQYHALLKMYRVSNESNGSVDNFSTLQAALDLLSTLRDYRLIEKIKISDKESYVAGMKITFERDALPLPLRPIAYTNSQWFLSSDWYLWPLKK